MITAIFNSKGGVGKSTTCVNLAYLTSKNYKTLLIDLDTQGASSYFFDKKVKKRNLLNKNPSKIIKSTQYMNLDIIPADTEFETYEKDLKKLLNFDYEFIFIDAPANISPLTRDILKYSDLIIVPALPNILSLRTYNQLLSLNLNKNLKLLLNRVENKEIHKKVIKTIMKMPKNQYFKSYIPKNNIIEEMPFYKKPAVKKDEKIKKAYMNVLKEII